jgi:hypothetical protein
MPQSMLIPIFQQYLTDVMSQSMMIPFAVIFVLDQLD